MLFPQELNQLVFIVWTKRDLSKNEMDFPKQIPFKQCESYESLSDYDIWMSFIGYFMPMFQKRITKEISLFQSDNFGCKLLMQRCHWLDIALFFFYFMNNSFTGYELFNWTGNELPPCHYSTHSFFVFYALLILLFKDFHWFLSFQNFPCLPFFACSLYSRNT